MVVVLLPRSGNVATAVAPVGAALITDKGSIPLTVTGSSMNGLSVPGALVLELELPGSRAGMYRAQRLEIEDQTGRWSFDIGDWTVRTVAGPAPRDLIRMGGTTNVGAADGGSVQAFEVTLRNASTAPIEVTDVATRIPGLAVNWLLVHPGDEPVVVDRITILADDEAEIVVGTTEADHPVQFVFATPEFSYIGDDADVRRLLLAPVVFTSGFAGAEDVAAYVARLPPDACAQRR